jgi:protein-tyrosine phosphatase
MIEFAKEIYYIISTSDKTKNILIHCYAGRSRSVTCIIYYLMKKYNYNYDQILNYIKNIKPDVGPNLGFEEELKKIKFN